MFKRRTGRDRHAMLSTAFLLWAMNSTATSSSSPTTAGTPETPYATTTTPTSAPWTRTTTNAWMTALPCAKVIYWHWCSQSFQKGNYRWIKHRQILIHFPPLLLGGYWYNCCTDSNLNGVLYRYGEHTKGTDGITWYAWHGPNYSLKRVEMKVRPVGFQP